MADYDLLVENAEIFYRGELVKRNILVSNGKIARVIDGTSADLDAKKTIDASGKIILPGIIDPHVHFREPGMTHKEDFFSGSMAAAAGGITTFLDMPNTKPETISIENLEDKRNLAEKSVVNYGFHFGASKDNNIDEIRKLDKLSFASVKVFMNVSTGKMLIEDERLLREVFSSSKLTAVHAEGDMVRTAIGLNNQYGNGLYLCHISSKEEIEFIKDIKKNSKPFFVEVSPHHLFLCKDDKPEGRMRSFFEMKPELKSREDNDALWEGIYEGIIDTVGTDHAPHSIEEKESENYPYGIPGNETMLPLMLNAFNENRIDLRTIVRLCSENPAKIFKLKGKGYIEEGFDADLTIVDVNKEKVVNNEELFTKCRWSPFNGWKLKGWPVMTIVNGNVVFDNGDIDAVRGKEVEYYE